MTMSELLTLVIPTRNRSHLVRNQIEYYGSTDFPYKMIYIDASDHEEYNQNVEFVRQAPKDLNVRLYRAKPSLDRNPARRINDQFREIIDDINSKYVCQSGDDDFFFETGLRKAVAELDHDADLSACGGYCLLATTGPREQADGDADSGEITIMATTNATNVDPFLRVRDNVAHFSSTTYYVSRREIWRKCYFGFSEAGLESGLIEQLMCAVLLANGQVKRLDMPFVLRHLHARNGEVGRVDLSYDIFDPGFYERIDSFCAQIGGILEEANVNLPVDWKETIRLGIISMSLKNTSRAYGEKVRSWYHSVPKPRIRDLLGEREDKALFDSMLQKVADNAMKGLTDPKTGSFLQKGLAPAPNVV